MSVGITGKGLWLLGSVINRQPIGRAVGAQFH